jgi:hypothetical protein
MEIRWTPADRWDTGFCRSRADFPGFNPGSIVRDNDPLQLKSGWVHCLRPEDGLLWRMRAHGATISSTDGDISVTAGQRVEVETCTITALTREEDGNIGVSAKLSIDLVRSSIIAATLRNGSNLTLNASGIVLNDDSLVSTNARHHGGNVVVFAKTLLESPDSVIVSTSTIDETGGVPLTFIYIIPPLAGLEAIPSLQPVCSQMLDLSTFLIQGRGGVPEGPGNWQLDFNLTPWPDDSQP